MGLADSLKRLDARVLPPLAAALARLGRGARRLRVVRVLAVVISLVVVLIAVYAAGRPAKPTYAPAGSTIQLGVPEGGSIPQYIVDSNARLRQLMAAQAAAPQPGTPQAGGQPPGAPIATQPATGAAHSASYFALVSMSAYLTPQQLATTLAGLALQYTEVIMRVPSSQQTEIIYLSASDLQEINRGMVATADAKQQDVHKYAMLQTQVTGSSLTDRTLRRQYRGAEAIAQLEASKYRSMCACVYAVVVHAAPTVLGQLAGRTGVRVVDPAPAQLSPDRAVFLPPFPDQRTIAEPPPSSGAFSPSGS